MRFLKNVLLVIALFAFIRPVFSDAAFQISTADSPVIVVPEATSNINYTVIHQTGLLVPGMQYVIPNLTNRTGGTCGDELATNTTCTVALTLTAPNFITSFFLEPLGVCGFSGRVCSVPNSSGRVLVNVVSSAGTALTVLGGTNSVGFIDTGPDVLASTEAVGAGPRRIAVTPDGSKAYVTNLSANSVSVIDTATRTVTTTIVGLSGTAPRDILMSPAGDFVYVLTTAGGDAVNKISTVTDTVVLSSGGGVIGAAPADMAINAAGTRVYVVNHGTTDFSTIDTATLTLVTPLITAPTGANPAAVAISNSQNKAFVANFGGNSVTVFNATTGLPITTIALSAGSEPLDIAATPDGLKVYTANTNGVTASRDSTVINAVTNAVSTNVFIMAGGTDPTTVRVSPDGTRAYVLADSGSVGAIDTSRLLSQQGLPLRLQLTVRKPISQARLIALVSSMLDQIL